MTTSMDCPTIGTLRTHLDHPSPEVEAHLDTCRSCRDLVVTVAADAGTVGRLLDGLIPPQGADEPSREPDPAVRVSERRSRRRGTPTGRRARSAAGTWSSTGRASTSWASGTRMRRPVAVGVAAVLAVTLVMTPGGRTAVAQFLDTFRSERLQVVQFNPEELETVYAANGDFGPLEDVLADKVVDVPEPIRTTDAAEAAAVSGLTPKPADQLRQALSVTGDDTFYVAGPGGQVTLTLGATADNGVPAALDGVVVRIAVPPAVVTVVTDQTMTGAPDGRQSATRGPRGVVAGTAGTLEVTSEGAPLAEVRSFLLSLPELPDGLRTQLENIDDWQNTLPIPLPTDGIAWEDVVVDGREGVAFGDNSGLAAAVLWQGDGVVHWLAGSESRQALLDLATRQ